MISTDQPIIFGKNIIAANSSIEDGNIKKANMPQELVANVDENRKKFLEKIGIKPEQTILIKMSYEREDFTRYSTVEAKDLEKNILHEESMPINDALLTTQPGVALFLPLADCVGAILYDPTKKVLMVSHLGRHNIEQNGAFESVKYMKEKAGVDPKNLQVWLSPSAGRENYPLFAFDNKSQQEVVLEQLETAGVQKGNIETANIDTTTNENYFSHSEYLKDNTKPNGRFAIVAMMP